MNGSNAEKVKAAPNKLQSIQEMKEKIRRMKENPARKRIDEAGERYIKNRHTLQPSQFVELTNPGSSSGTQEEVQIIGCPSWAMIADVAGPIKQPN